MLNVTHSLNLFDVNYMKSLKDKVIDRHLATSTDFIPVFALLTLNMLEAVTRACSLKGVFLTIFTKFTGKRL